MLLKLTVAEPGLYSVELASMCARIERDTPSNTDAGVLMSTINCSSDLQMSCYSSDSISMTLLVFACVGLLQHRTKRNCHMTGMQHSSRNDSIANNVKTVLPFCLLCQ